MLEVSPPTPESGCFSEMVKTRTQFRFLGTVSTDSQGLPSLGPPPSMTVARPVARKQIEGQRLVPKMRFLALRWHTSRVPD
nr:MAG: hypothetical protein H3RhizoLitter151650_000003 [Mitovirus sp.]